MYPLPINLMSHLLGWNKQLRNMKDKVYTVEIDRTSVRTATFTVIAPNESVAEDLALEEAANYNYYQQSEGVAEYEIIELKETGEADD